MLMPLAHSDVGLERITLAHGLAHAAISSRRPWVSEGVAHFRQALEREQLAGRKAALDYMGLHRAAFVAAEEPAGTAKGNDSGPPLISTFDETFYRSKAMYVWWMLHDMLGDVPLQRALAAYRPERDLMPSYVQKLVEAQAGGRSLEWFFDDWVYRDRGLPDFKVDSAFPRTLLRGSYSVAVNVMDLNDVGAEVPVIVRAEGGEVPKRVEVRGRNKGFVRIEVPAPPTAVVVNDGSVPEMDYGNNTFSLARPAK